MSELKPCPFCGGNDVKSFFFDPYDGYQGDCSSYIVRCMECGAEVDKRHKAQAIEAWNRRADNDRLANGVIVPPCKVGDTVWYELYGKIESAVVYSCVGVFKKQGVEITDANAKSSDGLEIAFNGKCIGKTVFLTKEEAEQALKESEQGEC